jgi:hypothetical protein
MAHASTAMKTKINNLILCKVRFQVLSAASMKIAVYCDGAPCSLIEADRRFRDAYCPGCLNVELMDWMS